MCTSEVATVPLQDQRGRGVWAPRLNVNGDSDGFPARKGTLQLLRDICSLTSPFKLNLKDTYELKAVFI